MRLPGPSSPIPTLLLLLTLLTPTFAARNTPPSKNAILLSDVQSLTFSSTRKTTSRRLPPIPQLKCISPPSICRIHTITTLRCVNQGHSYSPEDIEWACTASLPSTLKLGSTEVICEGYNSPEDPYVLKGSCGVEYRLALTEEGEMKYPELAGEQGWKGWMKTEEGGTDWAGVLFGILFLGVLIWIVVGACAAAERNRGVGGRGGRRPGWGGGGGGFGGWGGGGGGGPWDDPPPPYPGTKPSGGEGWRPGFWSGLAGGAAAGYMAGNRGGRRDERRYDQGGGLFGGRNTGGGWGSGSGSSSSASASGRHESTGFGSTTRR